MRLDWTDPALDDIEGIRDYIGKDSPYYARRFIERIFDAVEMLREQPSMGRLVPEANRDEVRELLFHGYRIIYLYRAERVRILTVLHGRRDLAAKDMDTWDSE